MRRSTYSCIEILSEGINSIRRIVEFSGPSASLLEAKSSKWVLKIQAFLINSMCTSVQLQREEKRDFIGQQVSLILINILHCFFICPFCGLQYFNYNTLISHRMRKNFLVVRNLSHIAKNMHDC